MSARRLDATHGNELVHPLRESDLGQPSPLIDGKYELIRRITEGGMGTIYEARHCRSGRLVALKVIRTEALAKNPDVLTRFRREARAATSIESRHIAQALDNGTDGATGNPYIVMELLAGEDLEQTIARLGPLHPELALRIVAQACLGLQKAHEKGVTHRDIKPANLFLAKQDDASVVAKLLDFGIAKMSAEPLGAALSETMRAVRITSVTLDASANAGGLTRNRAILGSPLYMSPEQTIGAQDVDHRSDIWSLGVVLYQALTGSTPHAQCDSLSDLFFAICREAPRDVRDRAPWVAPEIAAIVERALAPDPADRFLSAAEMYEAIVALLPEGCGLVSSMFTPMLSPSRSRIAPPLAGALELAPTIAAGDVGSTFAPSRNTTDTGDGLASSRMIVRRPARFGMRLALASAAMIVATVAFGGYRPTQPRLSIAPAAQPPVAEVLVGNDAATVAVLSPDAATLPSTIDRRRTPNGESE
jgi:serine/threonine-protein kinase